MVLRLIPPKTILELTWVVQWATAIESYSYQGPTHRLSCCNYV